eukprot:9157559-Alexandrium_andersonii.AAC.1
MSNRLHERRPQSAQARLRCSPTARRRTAGSPRGPGRPRSSSAACPLRLGGSRNSRRRSPRRSRRPRAR